MYVLLNLIVNLLIPDASIQFISRKVRFIICINNKTIFTTRRAASRLNNKRESPSERPPRPRDVVFASKHLFIFRDGNTVLFTQ